jgi:hypothetical protein
MPGRQQAITCRLGNAGVQQQLQAVIFSSNGSKCSFATTDLA